MFQLKSTASEPSPVSPRLSMPGGVDDVWDTPMSVEVVPDAGPLVAVKLPS